MSEDTESATRRTADMIEAGLREAGAMSLNDPVDGDAVRKQVRAFLDQVLTRERIPQQDIGVEVDGNPDTQELFVTFTGMTPAGNAFLADVLSRRGRDTLPFPVPQDLPADMDPRIVAAMDKLHAYYNDNMAWGSVHIVLDDGNVSDPDVHHCIGYAKQMGDEEGLAIARLLREVSVEQRRMLHEWWYGTGQFARAA